MTATPPTLKGGNAGASDALGGNVKSTVFSIAGGGSGLWYSIAAVILGVLWIKNRKK